MNEQISDARAIHPGIVKIIGLGQSLRGDDAAGLEAVRLWLKIYPATAARADVKIELAELPGIGLLNLLEGVQSALLVDAVHWVNSPGKIHMLAENQLEAFSAGSGSAHGWGVAETLSVGRQLTPSAMPAKLVLMGIEAGQLDLGEGLSPEVQAALPEAARMIEQFIQGITHTPSPSPASG